MSNALLMAGDRYNILKRARAVTSSSSDSLYLLTNLYDNDPAVPFRYGSAGTDVHVTCDGALYDNGDMEVFSSGQFTGWSKFGPGTVTTGTADTGTNSCSIQQGASLTYEYRDVMVRAGEELRFEARHRRGTTGTATSTIRIQNRKTGKYLTSGGAWQVASADIATTTSTTYQTVAQTFTMEGPTLCQADEVPLRIMLLSLSGGGSTATAFFDNVWLWPTWDFISVHGHNIPPGLIVPEFHSSTDNFSGSDTTETIVYPTSSMLATQPSFWGRLGSKNTRRYSRLKLVGTPDDILFMGQVVIGQAFPLTQCFGYPIEVGRQFAGHMDESVGGNVYSYAPTRVDPRTYALDYQANSLTNYEEAEWLIRRSRLAHHPCVFVPNDTEQAVVFGRFDESFTSKRTHNTVTTYQQRIKESAFPPVGL